MRLRASIVLLCVTCFASGQSKSPGEGRLSEGAYVNPYFQFSYIWPKTLQPVNLSSLAIANKGAEGEYFLFAARKGTEPFGVVLIAERLEDRTGAYPRKRSVIRDGPHFLDKIIAGWDTVNPGKVESRSHFEGTKGLAFDELDYRQAGEYNAAIVARVGQYLLAFRCNAKTEAQLQEMRASVLAAQHDVVQSGATR